MKMSNVHSITSYILKISLLWIVDTGGTTHAQPKPIIVDVIAMLVILTTYMNKVRKFINNMSGHKGGV